MLTFSGKTHKPPKKPLVGDVQIKLETFMWCKWTENQLREQDTFNKRYSLEFQAYTWNGLKCSGSAKFM